MRATRSEVFPGVLRITLPLPFELSAVNVHLVRLESTGYMLIDCGMDTDESFAALEGALEAAGIGWGAIRQILLTHMHPDHIGLAPKLIGLTSAKVFMHYADVRHLQIVTRPERRAEWIGRAFAESGVPKPLRDEMEAHFVSIRRNFHALNPDVLLEGGEEIPTAIGKLRVIWTPGHSPGHVCLYSAKHRLLFSGDQMLPKITPNISWMGEHDALADFLESLERLKNIDVDMILPSHGEPFSGHREWIDKTILHHFERCDEIRALLGERRSAHSLVVDLWRKKLSPINHQFALLEVLAHLEFMRRRGEIRSMATNGVVEWFV
jgi:glyoxylase-like metal-dependent hydrolase (beta-lactamase superfamily II)